VIRSLWYSNGRNDKIQLVRSRNSHVTPAARLWGPFMNSQRSIRELRAMLRAVRNEIEAFETVNPLRVRDNEAHKRIKEAKIKESVILKTLTDLGQKL